MSKILVIRSAATGEASVSNALIDAYLAAHPEASVTERDLDTNPVPHVSSASLAGIGRQAPEGAEFAATRALQDALIAEVFDADVIVIGLPVYNFGMPSTLKAWFDYVARAGTTFSTPPKALKAWSRASARLSPRPAPASTTTPAAFPMPCPIPRACWALSA